MEEERAAGINIGLPRSWRREPTLVFLMNVVLLSAARLLLCHHVFLPLRKFERQQLYEQAPWGFG